MSELKIRAWEGAQWETIKTNHAKVRKNPSWKWAAHRGAYPTLATENTIPAMIRAKEMGFGYCEVDIVFDSQNTAIVCHNPTITGTNASGESVTLTIAESTAEEITALKLGTMFRFGHVHPTTLDKLLDTARFIEMDLILDFKVSPTEAQAKAVACSVLAHGMQGKVIYMPVSVDAAGWIAEVDTRASIEFVSGVPTDVSAYVPLLAKCDHVGFDVNAQSMPTSDAVANLRANGLGLSFWNVAAGNYEACLDFRPKAMTLAAHASDFHAWEKTYLDSVKLW